MDELDLGNTIKGFIPGQKVLNRYKLERILGRGGMGVVWLARDEELERDVALKFLPEVVALDKDAVKELKRETRRSLELTHSNIIRIYDFLQDARTAAISMEYVAGDTLASRRSDLPKGFYEPAEISHWVEQLCAALEHAHAKAQIVHRDLKPANLMIDARGDLKVADFGIAASVSDSVSRISAQGGSSGTPVYMSPQQMMGEKPAVTDDIYALGATLFDLLTGKPPFYSGNIIAQVQSKVPPSLGARRKEFGAEGDPLPISWEQTVAACLSKDAAARPQSAGEVAERLGLAAKGNAQRPTPKAERPILNTEPKVALAAADTPSPPDSKTGTQKSKAPVLAGVAAGALLLGGLGWYFGFHGPEQRRLAAEKLRIETEQRLAAEKAAAEQAERERRASEARAQEEERRIAGEKARQEEVARIKAEQERQERERLEALDKQRARLLADLMSKVEVARRNWDFEGFDRLEREVRRQAQELDENRLATLNAALAEAGRELTALSKRVEQAANNARNAWLELKRAADRLRTSVRSDGTMPDDMRQYFQTFAASVAQALRYRDAPSGREFSLTQHGFYDGKVVRGEPTTALLVAYGGAGMSLSLGNEPRQDVVGIWENLTPGEHLLRIDRPGFASADVRITCRAGELGTYNEISQAARWQPLVDPKKEFLARVQGTEWQGKYSFVDPFGVTVVSATEIMVVSYGAIRSLQMKLPATVLSIDPVAQTITGRYDTRWKGMWEQGDQFTLQLSSASTLEMRTKINRKEKVYVLTR